MKTKRQNHHRGWKQALSVLLVFALAAGLVLSMPALSGVAYAAPTLWDDEDVETPPEADPDNTSDSGAFGPSTVKVVFPTTMTGEPVTELKAENTVVDLYLIAPAVPLSGYDVYVYCMDNSMPYYYEVKSFLEEPNGWRAQEYGSAPAGYVSSATGDTTPTEWLEFRYAPADPQTAPVDEQERLAELLAELFFAPNPIQYAAEDAAEEVPGLQGLVEAGKVVPVASPAIDDEQGNLPAGLYLDVVHGKEMAVKDYAVHGKATNGAGQLVDKVCTIAYSNTKVYTFQPQLFSLPSRVDENGNTQVDTTQPGDWAYSLTVTAKGEETERFADLQIEKRLDTLVNGGSAVFVFRVRAYDPNAKEPGKPVYETVITLRVDSSDENSLRSEVITGKIPVGSTVVVTEEYSGAGYRFSAADVTVRWSDKAAPGTAPGLVKAPVVDAGEHSITITDIPAGTIHLTTPQGEEHLLPDGTTETVRFTNVPDTTTSTGGSVINSFTQGEDGGWTWTQRSYNAQTGAWGVTETAPVNSTEEG